MVSDHKNLNGSRDLITPLSGMIGHITRVKSEVANNVGIISVLRKIFQFVFDVFVLYVLCNFYCTALLCYLVL